MFDLFQFLGDEDSVITILDVGAALTEVPPYQHLLDIRRARVIGFEPDEKACLELSTRFGSPHRFFPYFIGDGKSGTYWETNWGPTGSLFQPNEALLAKFQLLAEVTKPVAKHPVSTRRLDDIPEIDDVDFVKIDVQGSELGIFQNAKRVLDSTLLIQTEVSFVESYIGQPMFSDVDAFLRLTGFQFHDFLGFGSRAFKPTFNPAIYSPNPCLGAFRQKIWADAYYTRDWMKLHVLPQQKLVKYAFLMHEIVRSYDLAYLALVELDGRYGGDAAPRYLKVMQEWGRCDVIEPVGYDENWMPVLSSGDSAAEGATDNAVPPVDSILLQTTDGTLVSVPTDLTCTVTYVLLEQERWMEKELPFLLSWLRPGMNVIDIGANVGVYCLPLAKRVGPNGSAIAFEPGSGNRRNLVIGRAANELANLSISSSALADSVKDGWLLLAGTGDLNALIDRPAHDANVERVPVSTLDVQLQENHWPPIDFVKIDAEGQEANIIRGGRGFFGSQSPLIMFEVVHCGQAGEEARPLLEAMGYGIYRLLGDSSLLVPVAADEPLDAYELNLFAAKPDRANDLAARGCLVLESDLGAESYALTRAEEASAVAQLLALPYARHFEFTEEDIRDCAHGKALVAFAAYRFCGLSPARRIGLLRKCHEEARNVCGQLGTAAGLATLARISNALGFRDEEYRVLSQMLSAPLGDLDSPFFPPCPRYENVSPAGHELEWFAAATMEQLELVRAHSSIFSISDGFENLESLCGGSFASAEMLRRVILKGILSGWSPARLADFVRAGERHSHCNADFWIEENLARTVGEVWAVQKDKPLLRRD